MTNNPSHDHHFVPVFYLKRWIVVPEKRLVEYRRRGDGVIRPRWTGPRGTGYERHLYDTTDGSEESLEDSFMMPADTNAAEAMQVFMSPGQNRDWTQAQRSSWSRFIMSMLMRHPDDIDELKQLVEQDWTNLTDEMREAYSHGWQDGMPESAEEWWEQNRDEYSERALFQWLRGLIDNEGIGRTINSMSWNVANVAEARHRLLTSDKPICVPNSIGTLDAFIIMPLTPTKLFVAVRRMETLELILQMPMNELVARVNREVVLNARRFVFAANISQSRFVSNHFGRSDQPSWMMRLAQKRARDREQERSP